MTWWVIAVVVWVVASFALAGVVVLLSRRGRQGPRRPAAAERRPAGLRAPGRGRIVAPGGPTARHQGTRGRYVTTSAQRHRRR